MNILYIGGGFVGACSAAVSADSGHNVLVYDIDKNKVEKLGSQDKAQIESCIFEDGLSDLLIRNHERIRFTTDYDDVVSFVEIASTIFMCLPTPEIGETGESDLSFYNDALAKLINIFLKRNGEAQSSYILLVNKSTVPVELIDAAQEMMDVAGVNNVSVVSNPEFLVEGKAIENSIHPDRVVVGALKQQDFDIMRELYQRFYTSSSVSYLEVNPKEAAAGKLLSNYYMFHKLMACFDVAGRTAEAFSDISFESLRTIITTDKRVNPWGLYDSLYAGGSCLIKDARSLSFQLQKQGKSTELIDEVYKANKRQLRLFLERAEAEAMYDFTGKTVAVLGLSFKQDTNDVRNSPAFDILSFLQDKGVS
ncbi:MAG: UDP-glucose/GDP-mannose dehydrogenase family protein, partial [Candidatus Magasanikbacteria bacterium]|nr:UDP-glucose/GDP-mannose dehydrogenase family protein [Candidatus Magasanikbacteria bacterium]